MTYEALIMEEISCTKCMIRQFRSFKHISMLAWFSDFFLKCPKDREPVTLSAHDKQISLQEWQKAFGILFFITARLKNR